MGEPCKISDHFSKNLAYRLNVSAVLKDNEDDIVSATELDSHAGSPVVGKYVRILEDTGRKASVSGFTSELGKPMSVPVVNAAIAYDCGFTGDTKILVIYNALYFRNMEVNIIPPFMMLFSGSIRGLDILN